MNVRVWEFRENKMSLSLGIEYKTQINNFVTGGEKAIQFD